MIFDLPPILKGTAEEQTKSLRNYLVQIAEELRRIEHDIDAMANIDTTISKITELVGNIESIIGSKADKTELTNGSVTRVGIADVGNASMPMYLDDGIPTASGANIGTADRPIYMAGGVLQAVTHAMSEYLLLTGGVMSGALTLATNSDLASSPSASDNSPKIASTAWIAQHFASGSTSITPTADTMTSIAVTFGKTFASVPKVVATPVASSAEISLVSVSGITATGCTIWLLRSSATATTINWVATDL